MAIQINGNTVIDNSRKGSFKVLNPGTTQPSSPVTGDFYFNTTDNAIKTYNGSEWK